MVRMGFPFARHASERGNGALKRVPIERFGLKVRTPCVDVSINKNTCAIKKGVSLIEINKSIHRSAV
jgi:hypothetical protein